MNSNQITPEEITKSKLLAKAVVEKDGKVFIVAVFERSEYYRFFFRFQAKSKRSPRKSWKYLPGQYYIMNAGVKNHTLESFMQSNYPGREFKVRYAVKKKYVLTFFDRIANPTKYSIPIIPHGATFEIANRITTGKPLSKYDRAALRGGKINYS